MGDFDDLGAVPVSGPQSGVQDFADLGAMPKQVPDPDMSDVQKVFKQNLTQAKGDKTQQPNQPVPHPAQSFKDDWLAGWQMSTMGLGVTHQSMPDVVLPEHADRLARILSMAGTFAGDIPAMLVGGAAGAKIAGKPGMMAGAFAFPAGLRQALVDHYQKGDIKDPQDFVDRASSVLMQTLKGGATGLAVYATGKGVGNLLPAAAMPLAKAAVTTAAEGATMTTVAAAMDGKLPKAQDFVDNAAFMALMHGTFSGAAKLKSSVIDSMSDHVSDKAMDVYSKTGLLPHEVSDMAQQDPVVRQEMLSKDPVTPPSLEKFNDPKAEPDTHVTIDPNPELTKGSDAGDLKVEPLPEDKNPGATDKEGEPQQRSKAVNSILSTIGEQPDAPKEKINFDKLYYSFLDDKDPLKNLTKSLLGEEALGSKDDPYGLARSIGNVSRKADLIIEKGPRNADTMERTGTPGLAQIWDKVDDGKEYVAYRKAKHAVDLEKAGITSGVDLEDAKSVVKELGPKYKDIAKEEVKFNNDNIDYARDLGLISKDSAKAIKEKWENYASMSRVLGVDEQQNQGTGSGLNVKNPLKSIQGSERQTIDPRISAIKNTHALIAMAEKNRVMTSIAKLIDQSNQKGDTSFGSRAKVPLKSIEVQAEEAQRAMEDQGLFVTRESLARDLKSKGLDLTSEQFDKAFENEKLDQSALAQAFTIFRRNDAPLKDDQFQFFENGKKVIYENVPEDLVKTVRGMDDQSVSALVKMLSGPSKLLRTGTLSNPAFGLRHFMRQEMLATSLSKDLYVPLLHTVKGLSGLMGESSEEFDNWVMHGGGSDSIASIDNDYIKSKIFDLDEQTGFLKNKVNQVQNGLQFTKHFIELTDEARTFQKYQNRLSSGIDPWKASFDARDTGIDVQRQGANMRAYSMLDPFQTIKIQGMDLIARRMADDPVGTGAKLFATITIPSMLLWWANHDKKWFQETPDKIRDTNWQIPIGDPDKDGHVIKIPKPFEPGVVFGSLPERLLEKFFTDNPHAFKNFSQTIGESVAPGYVPTAVQPVIEQFANKSFLTKSPLIPKQMENVLPEYQAKPYTSDVAKIIASGLRLIPSDLTQKPGSLGSPAIIDNYIQNWTGGSGQLLVAGLDKALEKSGLADKMGVNYIHDKPDPTWADNPFFKSFVVRYPTENSKSVNDFFDRFEKTQVRMNTISMLGKQGDIKDWGKEQQAAMSSYEFMRLDGMKQAISKQMGLAQTTYRMPEDVVDKTQKRQLLDFYYTSITNTARMANTMLDDLEKQLKEIDAKRGGH